MAGVSQGTDVPAGPAFPVSDTEGRPGGACPLYVAFCFACAAATNEVSRVVHVWHRGMSARDEPLERGPDALRIEAVRGAVLLGRAVAAELGIRHAEREQPVRAILQRR